MSASTIKILRVVEMKEILPHVSIRDGKLFKKLLPEAAEASEVTKLLVSDLRYLEATDEDHSNSLAYDRLASLLEKHSIDGILVEGGAS